MAEAQYSANHVINPITGYLENPAYSYDFDSERKIQFLKSFIENGCSIYKTCNSTGVHHSSVNKHYQIDAKFREEIDQAREIYRETLDGISKINAMNPKSVIERIFQLKSLYPEKYADQKNSGNTVVNLTLDLDAINASRKRSTVIDAEEVNS